MQETLQAPLSNQVQCYYTILPVEHKEMLCRAEKFNENSFSLVQCGYLLVNKKIVKKEPKQEFDIVETKKNFGDERRIN